MANSPQARKRARQAETHRQRNASHRSKYRTYIKQVDNYLAKGDLESATQAYKDAVPKIDSMVNRGLIHKNKAARHKSRLNSKLKVLSTAA